MHKYKNYVHLEGIAADRAVPSADQLSSSFDLIVKDEGRNLTGDVFAYEDKFRIELWGRHVQFGAGVKGGMYLMVDGSLKVVSLGSGTQPSERMVVKAHRVIAVDRTLTRKSTVD